MMRETDAEQHDAYPQHFLVDAVERVGAGLSADERTGRRGAT